LSPPRKRGSTRDLDSRLRGNDGALTFHFSEKFPHHGSRITSFPRKREPSSYVCLSVRGGGSRSSLSLWLPGATCHSRKSGNPAQRGRNWTPASLASARITSFPRTELDPAYAGVTTLAIFVSLGGLQVHGRSGWHA